MNKYVKIMCIAPGCKHVFTVLKIDGMKTCPLCFRPQMVIWPKNDMMLNDPDALMDSLNPEEDIQGEEDEQTANGSNW